MTQSRRDPAAPKWLWRLVAVTAFVPALLVCACADAVAHVDLPAAAKLAGAAKPARAAEPALTAPSVGSASAAETAPATMSPRQQVIAALVGYTAALGAADKSEDASKARQLLRPYLAPSRIGGLVQAMSAIWAKGETFYGADSMHVVSVTIRGSRAFAYDCDDTSGMGLVKVATGQTVPGSAGVARVNLVTRLDLVGRHWLVAFQLVEDVPCTP